MRTKTTANQNQNRTLLTLRLRRLDIEFLLSLIKWNEERDEHRGSRDRWLHKRAHVKVELDEALDDPKRPNY